MTDTAVAVDDVMAALQTVDDPEYPGVSIVDLGMIHDVRVDRGADPMVTVEVVPTYAGCPALEIIGRDVEAALTRIPSLSSFVVRFRPDVRWNPDRIRPEARSVLADDFTVVLRGRDGSVRCPVCGGADVEPRSEVGATRCRSVAWCRDCRNAVEVVR